MSESEHLTAILANLTAIRQYAHNGEVPRYAHIAEAKKHAEAMARDLAEADRLLAEWEEGYHAQYQKLARMTAQLAEAEARVGRLRGGITELRAELRRYYTGPGEADERIAELLMELDPGDLPDAAGEERA